MRRTKKFFMDLGLRQGIYFTKTRKDIFIIKEEQMICLK